MPKIAQDNRAKKLKSIGLCGRPNRFRNYLDWMTELPWSEKTKINTDLSSAQNIDESYELEKVKENY